jgi:hypothetical protein
MRKAKTFHGYRYAASYNGPSYSGSMDTQTELFRSIDAGRDAYRSRQTGSGAWPERVVSVDMEDGALSGEPVTEYLCFPATSTEDYMDLHPVFWDERSQCWTFDYDAGVRFTAGAREGYVITERF